MQNQQKIFRKNLFMDCISCVICNVEVISIGLEHQLMHEQI